MPLGSSFWLDEAFTAFLVRHGYSHPSLADVPQAVASIYYYLPAASVAVLGFSEAAFRLPSVLAMAAALFLTGRLAARLVHPAAAWLAVFASMALSGINYQAADARPYALGTCLAAASFLFLVRWMDSARWLHAALFVLFASLLWRVHLIYWPMYLVLACYGVLRIARKETAVGWRQGGAVAALLGLLLLPVLATALRILPQAAAHSFGLLPQSNSLLNALKPGLMASCLIGAWLIHRWPFGSSSGAAGSAKPAPRQLSGSAMVLIAGWWLAQPAGLFAYSWLSGNNVFHYRYLSVALPGAVLAAVLAASRFLPAHRWRHAAGLMALGVLLTQGQWQTAWPRHDPSDWRGAARKVNQLAASPATPVLCPSPFLEARPPAWTPDYPLPGFFYAHLDPYPIRGQPIRLPFELSPEATGYITELLRQRLTSQGRFVLYGWNQNVLPWREWFAARPELAGWRPTTFDSFGDVWVVLFERAPPPGSAIR
ncbi:MAG TPA: hypothetical protein VNN17_01665 [Terriglobia bacterium]|nr:hypothetical protein [Terriglobia bacterium]